ncbi:hypothetical protein M0657_005343 [Pyricularia oryzae]|uniref:Uncharacterized protein n=2 Tax=Pyricularia oryzae TaxID=318829 RepID=A0AA97NSB3_PYRO3|nr:hypothetical protein OOU_Y34scaffold00711g9 [Pyricularia oryzae Y34]KAI7920598.1 hypothetical protein M9X92_005794 [Pyricularia oryzae]KAI7923021.1 hypothetical protein M0657_005343 [Pyricularia oryzae]
MPDVESDQTPPQLPPPRRQQTEAKTRTNFLPAEVSQALSFGALTGTAGALGGAIIAVSRHRPALISTVLGGAYWFTAGSVFNGSRSAITAAYGARDLSGKDKIVISGAAGALAGMAQGALATGIRSSPPAALALMVLGAGGQAVSNKLAAREPTPASKAVSKQDWLSSKWSPLTPLTDKEYENMLQEKILKLDAEIAMVDDNIAVLREKQKSTENQK